MMGSMMAVEILIGTGPNPLEKETETSFCPSPSFPIPFVSSYLLLGLSDHSQSTHLIVLLNWRCEKSQSQASLAYFSVVVRSVLSASDCPVCSQVLCSHELLCILSIHAILCGSVEISHSEPVQHILRSKDRQRSVDSTIFRLARRDSCRSAIGKRHQALDSQLCCDGIERRSRCRPS